MQRSCAQCHAGFEITDDDLVFYDKVSPVFAGKKFLIPPPLQCPDCRFRRRMVWRREHVLKKRDCSACRCPIISIHTPDTPFPVYCLKCWWSDAYDPLQYGTTFDVNKSFLKQFRSLYDTVPQIAMMNDNGVGSENCEYTQDFAFGKNCYLITGAWELQDCYYCDCNCLQSRHLFDCYSVHASELVYDSLSSQKLYRCSNMNHCESCNDCIFGIDLKGCSDCVGCIGLRQQRFRIFNKQHTEDEYRKAVANLRLDSRTGVEALRKQFDAWVIDYPRKASHMVNCENCLGDDLFNCKNVYMGFQQQDAEYCKYIVHGDGSKNSYDVSQTGRLEWCYEGVTPDKSYMTHFTTWCWKSQNILYSDNCHNSQHLFGCIALKHKKFCVLNTQYTQVEYERLASKIIERMMVDGEWGEFFPMTMTPFCYNETAAQEYFPTTKEGAETLGVAWREDHERLSHFSSIVPDSILDTQDDIVDKTLPCMQCGKQYKILSQELSFYRTMNIPAPDCCYECRFAQRVARRNPRKLWNRQCAKCHGPITTSYAPERPEIVYCESCYLAAVY